MSRKDYRLPVGKVTSNTERNPVRFVKGLTGFGSLTGKKTLETRRRVMK